MSIKDLKEKIKQFLASDRARDLYISLIIILVAIAAFGLGRLSKANLDGPGVVIQIPDRNQSSYGASASGTSNESTVSETANASNSVSNVSVKTIFASKNGTKYYFPSCSGAIKIKEENKIWFSTEAAAQSAGFVKSSTCK